LQQKRLLLTPPDFLKFHKPLLKTHHIPLRESIGLNSEDLIRCVRLSVGNAFLIFEWHICFSAFASAPRLQNSIMQYWCWITSSLGQTDLAQAARTMMNQCALFMCSVVAIITDPVPVLNLIHVYGTFFLCASLKRRTKTHKDTDNFVTVYGAPSG
jgi:hypothetical protein